MKPTQFHVLFLFLGLTACQPSFSVSEYKSNGEPNQNAIPSSEAAASTVSQSSGAEATGSPLETCFSPGEACDKKIIQFINQAQKTLEVAAFSFSHQGIGKAIQNAHLRGVKVRMVVDREQSQTDNSIVSDMVAAGIPLKFGSQRGLMHNKFTIVDQKALETGSYNYSYAATSYNAENQLYLKDSKVIEHYKNDFEKLWSTGLMN